MALDGVNAGLAYPRPISALENKRGLELPGVADPGSLTEGSSLVRKSDAWPYLFLSKTSGLLQLLHRNESVERSFCTPLYWSERIRGNCIKVNVPLLEAQHLAVNQYGNITAGHLVKSIESYSRSVEALLVMSRIYDKSWLTPGTPLLPGIAVFRMSRSVQRHWCGSAWR